MIIKTVDHIKITVPTDCAEQARDFYIGILGLTEIPKPEPVKKNGGFWLNAGGVEVHVGLEDGIDRHNSSAHLGYLVDDAAAWREKLKNAGYEILKATAIADVERFYIRDPFGNRIEFMQRL